MINVARMMGLANDPDEFPGTYSLFDAEARRRVWWDVFYYDLYVARRYARVKTDRRLQIHLGLHGPSTVDP